MIATASMPSAASVVLSAARPASSSGIATAPSASTRSSPRSGRALDQRLMLLEKQIVRVRPVDPADLVDVAETLGGDQRGLGAGAFQQGVDRDGRAVKEQRRRGEVAAGLVDASVMPSTRRCGVDSACQKQPAGSSSNTATSVKVPPMSAATLTFAPLPARDFDWMGIGMLTLLGWRRLYDDLQFHFTLFDQLVGNGKQRRRKRDPNCLRGL